MNIKIPWEAADKITLEVLKDALRNLKADSKRPMLVFKENKADDQKEIKKHIDALTLIIKYFS